MNRSFVLGRSGWVAAVVGVLLLAPPVAAQTSTGTIRGTVRDSSGAPIAEAAVEARNLATGAARTTTANERGSYLLPGLAPGEYDVTARRIGHLPDARRVRLLVGQVLAIDFALTPSPQPLEEVVVRAAPVVETRTSEVATNVTPEQVNNLPQADRNFLFLAQLAPGVTLQGDRVDDVRKTFRAGAQGAEQVNVFIDGASYKNDILQGGVAGQDASRGNPFPRNAVQEFRVLTQNYKAEYEKASSAVITATTKSGGNTWERNIFFNFVGSGLVALDTFQRADQAANPATFRKPVFDRYQFGLSAGGPIVRNRLYFFGSYEGNVQDRTRRVNIQPPAGFPALDTVSFASYNGEFGSPFRGHLGLAKLTYQLGPASSLALSYNLRRERDIRDFGGLRAFTAATRFRNDVHTGTLKHSYVRGPWLNEATLSYQYYRYNPEPAFGGTVNRFYGFGCCAEIGSNITVQDFRQKRLSLRDAVTYSGFRGGGEHVVKVGANLDFLNYDIVKRNSEVPRFVYESFFPAGRGFAIPERVEFQAGDPNFGANNTEIGAFVQDDWSPIERLTLNLGLRWDYESHMVNVDYVTPRNVVDTLTKYNSQLFIPIDPNRYFTDGTRRSRFTGAWQPRLGASLALDRAGRTTIFGGFGIFYDRTLFDHAIEEKFALQHPSFVIHFRPPGDTTSGRVDWNNRYLADTAAVKALTQTANTPEVKLLPNDIRPPKARHFTGGIRQLIGTLAVEAAYVGVRSSNTLTFQWANIDFPCGNGSCFTFRPIPGFSNILLADNVGKTWYNGLQVKIERPYQRTGRMGWGAGVAYTLAKRETQGFNDLFSFPNSRFYPRQVRNDERHRVVTNWIVDLPFAYGLQFSGLFVVGSGVNQDVGDRFFNPNDPNSPRFVPGGFDAPTFTNLDLRLRKDFPPIGGTRLGVTAEVFNVFNKQNLGDFDTFNPADPNFGKARGTISDPRRFQLGVEYDF